MLQRGRWFFAKVTGRRRIGKTTLIQQALQAARLDKPLFYVQIPDSEAVGVLSAVNDALETFGVPADRYPRPRNLAQLARLWEALAAGGYVLVLDEFQYFNRKGYEELCSYLQASVDRLSARAAEVQGGLIVLGSVHTEMAALLEDRSAPLYNRITDDLQLSHLDIASVLEILRDHAEPTPERLLFLWNLFEGVPKFYRDCYEQGVLGAARHVLLRRIFFESSSPLRGEADNWFLRELRGRYDVVLKFVARNPGARHNDLVQTVRDASGDATAQVGGYLQVLIDRFRLIERRLPAFAKPEARRNRYYVTDNFLRSWLAALANPVAAIAFRPVDGLVEEADQRLAGLEGRALERLVGQLYEERSRKGIGDFPLSQRVQGYWDRGGTEIDVVAVNEPEQRLRLCSCKRSAAKLLADVTNFREHVARFLASMPQFRTWRVELVGISPVLDEQGRAVLVRHGVLPQDLEDLTSNLV
jgi:hypothetical protein